MIISESRQCSGCLTEDAMVKIDGQLIIVQAAKSCHLTRSTHSAEQAAAQTQFDKVAFEVNRSILLGCSLYIKPLSHYEASPPPTPRHPSMLHNDH